MIAKIKISRAKHRGLRNFIESNDPRGLPANYIDKIRKMISFLRVIESIDELHAVSFWNIHPLTGDRQGDWSLTVSRNWRLTFQIDHEAKAIIDLDFEDYH